MPVDSTPLEPPSKGRVLTKKKQEYMTQKIKDRVGEFVYNPEEPEEYKKARK